MDEPQTPRADRHAIPDTPDTSGAQAGQNDASGRFARGEDMAGLYAQMRPDQRTAVAGELVRLLALVGDERAEEFRERLQEHVQIETDREQELLSPDQVALVDNYVRQQHPKLIEQAVDHPVIRAALAKPGAPAEGEEGAPSNRDKIMPMEDIASRIPKTEGRLGNG